MTLKGSLTARDNIDVESSSSSSPSNPSLHLTTNPHLALFQSMAQVLPRNPSAVISTLSTWLSNSNSPQLWAPFALSLRGFAYEAMDEPDLARMDYIGGLHLYDLLIKNLGTAALKRMENNVKFMRVRVRTLPPRKCLFSP